MAVNAGHDLLVEGGGQLRGWKLAVGPDGLLAGFDQTAAGGTEAEMLIGDDPIERSQVIVQVSP